MTKDIHQQKILIIDFGSQYTQLIARRVREAGVFCEIKPHTINENDIKQFAPAGIILSGGPNSVMVENTPQIADIVFTLGCPVLGICYGMQAMAQMFGGKVASSDHREYGHAEITVLEQSSLLDGINDHVVDSKVKLDVWMSHGDHVIELPSGFTRLAESANSPIAAIANEKKKLYGLQFHPEVTHTPQGQRIYERFVHDICGCDRLWTAANIIDDSIQHIRKQVGKDRVLLALSGGVDSSVTATLLHKAIGDQLVCVFVDTGLLRLHEADQVMKTYADYLGIHVIKVDAKAQFMSVLKGITDPEHKRKIVGKTFIDVFDEEAKKLGNVPWLAQGTIYPDVIESAGTECAGAHVIKSHHNVGGLPEKMQMKLLEPLRELFKDEVRKIGLALGLPRDSVYRHPFPGPGLALRILGEVKQEHADTVRLADAIFIEELRNHDLYDKVGQAFAVFLPVKSVGVVGDGRQYEYVIALRAVETIDFMTAHWANLPYEVLSRISHRIINEVKGVSRVVYDISGKPPATIEWE